MARPKLITNREIIAGMQRQLATLDKQRLALLAGINALTPFAEPEAVALDHAATPPPTEPPAKAKSRGGRPKKGEPTRADLTLAVLKRYPQGTNGGVLAEALACKRDVMASVLSRLLTEGKIEKVAAGVYKLPTAAPSDEEPPKRAPISFQLGSIRRDTADA